MVNIVLMMKSAQDRIDTPTLRSVELTLRQKMKYYVKRSEAIRQHLVKNPDEWGRFQSEFNKEINLIFNEILKFAKIYTDSDLPKVQKLRQIFVQRFRNIFLNGTYNKWSLNKPYGYAGDFKIIDEIYQNNPPTKGFERLFDNYFLMSSISMAVRNRKEDFKRIIAGFVEGKRAGTARIMNLASGPCREIYELFRSGVLDGQNVIFDCYDHDKNAIKYAQGLLNGIPNVNFYQENALRISASRNVRKIIDREYDFIYSTGLFDYLNHKITVRLLRNLKLLLKPHGVLAVSDVRDRFSNPSVFYMEWVGEWDLVYNNDEAFRRDFIDAGFTAQQLKFRYEQQGIMQYVLASNHPACQISFLNKA